MNGSRINRRYSILNIFCNFNSVICASLWICVVASLNSKYSAETNRKNDKEPFRMHKHNLLWEKAQKNLAPGKLDVLKKDLAKLDKMSLELKHLQGDGKDLDGSLEAEVRERFLEIVERYSLIPNEVDQEKIQKQERVFDNKKVNKIWEQALYDANFLPEELATLKNELKHHEDKLKEYQELSSLIDSHDSISENDIRYFEKPKPAELKKMRRDLKDKFHNITNQQHELNKKVNEKMVDPDGDFRDRRVLDLWIQAKNTGFSDEELDSIKQELKHFQVKIDKHVHWMEEKRRVKMRLTEGEHHLKDKQEFISEKVYTHGKQVKKYYATLLDRVSKREEL